MQQQEYYEDVIFWSIPSLDTKGTSIWLTGRQLKSYQSTILSWRMQFDSL